MRRLAVLATGVLLIAASGPAAAGAFPGSGISRADVGVPIERVATEKKSETVTQKVKRAWKNLVGYKFDVSCPFAGSRTCSETGSSKADAHGKCIAKNFGCWVTDAR